MAKRELKLQTDIIKSVRAQGGWARKLSSSYMIGMPDLLISMFPLIPFLAEVKDLGKCVDDFDRQLDVTEKQRQELCTFNSVYDSNQTPYTPHRRAAMLLVGLTHRGERRLVCLPWLAERLTAAYTCEPQRYRKRLTGGQYDIQGLLRNSDICRVRVM